MSGSWSICSFLCRIWTSFLCFSSYPLCGESVTPYGRPNAIVSGWLIRSVPFDALLCITLCGRSDCNLGLLFDSLLWQPYSIGTIFAQLSPKLIIPTLFLARIFPLIHGRSASILRKKSHRGKGMCWGFWSFGQIIRGMYDKHKHL